MKKNKRIIIALWLLLLGIAVLMWPPMESNPLPFSLRIASGAMEETVVLWEDPEAPGSLYGFLPSFAQLNTVYFQHCGKEISLDGQKITDGMSLSGLELNRAYSIGNQNVTFLRSENLPAMFIRTATGSTEALLSDRTKKEKIALQFLDSDGSLLYNDTNFKDSIRGRGNTTWEYPKKPFNLYLSRKTDWLGTGGRSANYALLANAIDRSQLRNALIYRLASETTEDWQPDTRHVDVYLNGEYAGLYLLSERVEVSASRLHLQRDDVLLNLELTFRAKPDSIMELYPDVSAEFEYPESLSDIRRRETEKAVQHILNALSKHRISEDALEDYIDLDSWVHLYLIQEVSDNYDSGYCSLYFYLRDGKLYAGPVWDYDNSLGVRKETYPDAYLANVFTVWNSLWQYRTFREAVQARYQDGFRDRAVSLFSETCEAMDESLTAAKAMDDVRWPNSVLEGNRDSNTAQMQDFFRRRIAFLDSAWIDGVEYVTAELNYGDGTAVELSVPYGTALRKSAYFNDLKISRRQWYLEGSEIPYDFSQPMTANIWLYAE